MSSSRLSLACLLTLAAACSTPPPRPWLRYEVAGVTDWQARGNGVFGGTVYGADVSIDLHSGDAHMLVVVENQSDEALGVRLGPNAGASRGVLGQVLLRELDGAVVGGPGMAGYLADQKVVVDAGWRATFYLDQPLGRELKLGQYFVFAAGFENAAGEQKRCLLPVVAKLGGTAPVGDR